MQKRTDETGNHGTARRSQFHRFAGRTRFPRRPVDLLPCRRSRVRVPSAAPLKSLQTERISLSEECLQARLGGPFFVSHRLRTGNPRRVPPAGSTAAKSAVRACAKPSPPQSSGAGEAGIGECPVEMLRTTGGGKLTVILNEWQRRRCFFLTYSASTSSTACNISTNWPTSESGAMMRRFSSK